MTIAVFSTALDEYRLSRKKDYTSITMEGRGVGRYISVVVMVTALLSTKTKVVFEIEEKQYNKCNSVALE